VNFLEPARTRVGFVASYYRRVAAQALREATHPWVTRLGTSAALAGLTFVFSWAITGRSALTGLEVALATLGGWWVVVFAWFCFTIPPRIEAEVRSRGRDIEVVQEKVGMVNVARVTADECRMATQKARHDVIRAKDSGAEVDVDAIHAQAVHLAARVEDMLKNYGQRPGHRPYTEEMTEISRAVDGSKPADVEAAIEQLLALAAILDQHIYAGRYGA
jgi:hypothetical protein